MKTKFFIEVKKSYQGTASETIEIVKQKCLENSFSSTIYYALSLDTNGIHQGVVIETEESETAIMRIIMFLKKTICVTPIFVPMETIGLSTRSFSSFIEVKDTDLTKVSEQWQATEIKYKKNIACYVYEKEEKIHINGYSWGEDPTDWSLHVINICTRSKVSFPHFVGVKLERID